MFRLDGLAGRRGHGQRFSALDCSMLRKRNKILTDRWKRPVRCAPVLSFTLQPSRGLGTSLCRRDCTPRPAYLALELVLQAAGLIAHGQQLPVDGRLVPELALQGQHLVTEPPDVQPEVLLGSLSLWVPKLWK